ncbi:Asp-tRNA(Asn)/Glu-tRNA(Gln) amidotransferase subunit GatB [Patescibacteria group bacterium]|nr:Asp-tRNA(Asn)/Glu-tRNA(Gln) amidotransferase subunit GatB [Patescibacteria group bacterium]
MSEIITKENYRLVLGLEIHLHLRTERKMFCKCSADIWEKTPNSHTCPVCLGLPGALPVPNEDAVKKTQVLGLALGCKLNKDSRFDRKHYFYPDLPKGYQISQYKQPLCVGGSVELDSGFMAEVERIHLEEDVAKSFHEKDRTLLDFNKSGLPLVEIVTKPVFSDVKDAVDFCKKIQQLVRFLDIGDVDMEKGQMRLEANISLRTREMEEKEDLFDYKVEVKNINSFRFMEKAVIAEIERQLEVFLNGDTPIQENRGFNETTGKTVPQRTKEDAKDYRYFPEPDIPPMVFNDAYFDELRESIPELPHDIKRRLVENYGIKKTDATTLVDVFGLSIVEKFENYVKSGLDAQKVASILINRKETHEMPEDEFKDLIVGKKDTLDEDTLVEIIKKIIDSNPKAVDDFKEGKENSIQFLFGHVMRETKGKVDPENTVSLIKELIK